MGNLLRCYSQAEVYKQDKNHFYIKCHMFSLIGFITLVHVVILSWLAFIEVARVLRFKRTTLRGFIILLSFIFQINVFIQTTFLGLPFYIKTSLIVTEWLRPQIFILVCYFFCMDTV